jgi:epsilon-lactone hydrolase
VERSPDNVFVAGASAGGNLAAALLLRAKDEGLPMPAALVLLSPEVDLTESGDSFHTNLGIDHVLAPLMHVNLLYAGGHDLADPYLSPLFGDVTGFPPTFIQTGTRDLFLSNSARMHRKLRASGVEAELHVFEAMPHGGFGGAPEDLEVGVEVQRFLGRYRRRR